MVNKESVSKMVDIKKIRNLFLVALMIFFALQIVSARQTTTLVVLGFDDKTQYKGIGTKDIAADLILEQLINSGDFSVMERKVVHIKEEERLYGTDEAIKNAMQEKDFFYLLGSYTNITEKKMRIQTARKGDYLDAEMTKNIGKKHQAELLLCGIINGVGSGEKNERNPLWKEKDSFLWADFTLKLIRSETGEIVWTQQVVGKAKNRLIGVAGIHVGSDGLSGDLFQGALEDAARKAVSSLIVAAKTNFI